MADAEVNTDYDVLVIGGGSGGIGFSKRAASYGAKVCLFENKRLGGTCVNVGCVPKKIMFNTANVAQTLRHAKSYGFDFGENNSYTFSYPELKKRRDAHIVKLNGIYGRGLDKLNIDCVQATVKFVDKNTLEADGKKYRAERILIACGGSPRIPNIPGKEFIATSDDFFNTLEELPKKCAVVGAGYIAVELGHVMQSLGSDVSLFYRKGSVLRSFDADIQACAIKELKHVGVDMVANTSISSIEKAEDGTFTLESISKQAGTRRFEGYDYVLYAIGRNPVTNNLNADDLGLEVNQRGYVKSDEWEATAVDSIFALGDVNGKIELTPVAIRAGRKLADRLYGGKDDSKCDYEKVPSVVFLDPPIGTCGLTESQANEKHKGEKITIYTSTFRNMYHTIPDEQVKTFMKFVCVGEKETVVGLHMMGVACDEILQGFGVAMKMGATKEDMDSCVAIHPTAAEELVTMKSPKRQYVGGDGTFERYLEEMKA